MAKVKWKRSDEGYVESKDGRFDIMPLWCGTTTPQYYEVYDNEPKDGGSRVRIAALCDTQKECKEEVEDYLQRMGE